MITPTHPLTVICGSDAATRILIKWAVQAAHQQTIYLFDGNKDVLDYQHRIDLVRAIAGRNELGEHMYHASTFTALQVTALLEEIASGEKPIYPIYIADFLEMFYDEGVSYPEAKQLFHHSLAMLRILRQYTTIVVSANMPKKGNGLRWSFFWQLSDRCGRRIDARQIELPSLTRLGYYIGG